MLLHMLLLASQGLISREPKPATPWTEIYTARCGRDALQLVRQMRPLHGPITIRLNGRVPRGDVSALSRELGEIRAAYRYAFRCAPEGGGISLQWVRGLADGRGHVNFRSGGARFDGGRLTSWGAEDSNEEAFWYR